MQNAIKRGRPKKEKNYNSPFAARLRELIGEKTQQEIAEKLNITRQSIGQWINGNTTPDIATLCKLADYFNVSADYLLCHTDVKSPNTDLQAVCAYTGLSENAIKTMHRSAELARQCDSRTALGKEIIYGRAYMEALSDLLSEECIIDLVSELVVYRSRAHIVEVFKNALNISRFFLENPNVDNISKYHFSEALDCRMIFVDDEAEVFDKSKIIHSIPTDTENVNLIQHLESSLRELEDDCALAEFKLNKAFEKLKFLIIEKFIDSSEEVANDLISTEILSDFKRRLDYDIVDFINTRNIKKADVLRTDFEFIKNYILQKEGAADGKHNPQEE